MRRGGNFKPTGDAAVLSCFVFLSLVVAGAAALSLGRRLGRA
jgi:hypothetical protein